MRVRAAWDRVAFLIKQHLRVVRLGTLTAALVIYFVFLPSYMRVFFWVSFQSNMTLAIMLIIFSLIMVSLVWSTGQKIDAWAFLFINLRGPRQVLLDRIMSGFTQMGSGIFALGTALVFFLIGNRVMAYDLVLSTLTLWLLVEFVKFLIHRSRPFIRLTQTRVIGRPAIGRSFPSGHTSQVFLLATLLTQHFHLPVWAALLLYALALMVGITRMYVGAHYPRDVLAGAILGSAWGLLGIVTKGFLIGI